MIKLKRSFDIWFKVLLLIAYKFTAISGILSFSALQVILFFSCTKSKLIEIINLELHLEDRYGFRENRTLFQLRKTRFNKACLGQVYKISHLNILKWKKISSHPCFRKQVSHLLAVNSAAQPKPIKITRALNRVDSQNSQNPLASREKKSIPLCRWCTVIMRNPLKNLLALHITIKINDALVPAASPPVMYIYSLQKKILKTQWGYFRALESSFISRRGTRLHGRRIWRCRVCGGSIEIFVGPPTPECEFSRVEDETRGARKVANRGLVRIIMFVREFFSVMLVSFRNEWVFILSGWGFRIK